MGCLSIGHSFCRGQILLPTRERRTIEKDGFDSDSQKMTLTAYQETHGGREDSKSFPNLVILLWKLLVCSALDSQRRNLEKDLSSLVAKRVGALGAFRLAHKHRVGDKLGWELGVGQS